MNIDKIYKPLRRENYPLGVAGGVEYQKAVQELEEKYKELLKDKIKELKTKFFVSVGDMRFKGYMAKLYKYDIDLIERHTGMKWEDIIKED